MVKIHGLGMIMVVKQTNHSMGPPHQPPPHFNFLYKVNVAQRARLITCGSTTEGTDDFLIPHIERPSPFAMSQSK
jgi:hypothetical protein